MSKILGFLSNAISILLHPIAMPSIAILILSIFTPSVLLPFQSYFIWLFFFFIVITTWLIPALLIYGLYLLRIVKTIDLEERKDRIIGMIPTTIVYSSILFFLNSKYQISHELLLLFYSSIFTQIASMLITYFWKVSLHSVAISALTSYLAILAIANNTDELFFPLLTLVLLSGCVMSARLYLQKHNMTQIIVGIIIGITITTTIQALL